MAGLVKPKKREWKETNMALFGSDTEREVSAMLHVGSSEVYNVYIMQC